MIMVDRNGRKTISYVQSAKQQQQSPIRKYNSVKQQKNKNFKGKFISRFKTTINKSNIDVIYRDLTEKAIKKTYNLNYLRPYSSFTNHHQIQGQLQQLKIEKFIKQNTNKVIKKPIKQQLSSLIKFINHQHSHPNQKKKTSQIISDIEDEDYELTQNFLYNLKADQTRQTFVKSKINSIVNKNRSLSTQTKLNYQLHIQPKYSNFSAKTKTKQIQLDFDKNNVGIFCLQLNKVLNQSYSNAQSNQLKQMSSFRNLNTDHMPRCFYLKKNTSKQYYQRYLKNYVERKNILNNNKRYLDKCKVKFQK